MPGGCAAARGWFGWFTALPWGNPSVAAQVLAMLTFIFGGAGGIVNGSWQLDNLVHNTTWIPGHFHITVGTASAMTFMGIAFWMMPHLTGRQLLSRRLALASIWLWFGGMSVFALGMHWSGLYSVPRRAWISFLPQSVYDRVYGDAHLPLMLVAIGGVVLWLATIAFYIVFLGSLLTRRLPQPEPIPFAQALGGRESYSIDDAEPAGIVAHHTRSPVAAVLEHLGALTVVTAAATAAAYIPIFWPFLHNVTRATGWKVW